tara:strand:- start:891 stop:1127 length:237 start_codon:yes stop_codon:yes gene_type:complete
MYYESRKMIKEKLYNLFVGTSLGRTCVYTCGHVVISMNIVYWLTGASLFEAGLVSIIEPCINGCWYYFLDKLWIKKYG